MKIYKWYAIAVILFVTIFIILLSINKPEKQAIEKIRVYMHKEDRYVEMNLDEYLKGVVGAEMPAEFELEALKAQAVAARTYAIKKRDCICTDSTHCQAWVSKDELFEKWEDNKEKEYWEKICKAVDDTKGKIITYNGEVIEPLYHADSSQRTENNSEVWQGEQMPYLVSVESNEENTVSENKFKIQEIIGLFEDNIKITQNDVRQMRILQTTKSGRVKMIEIGGIEIYGTKVREILNLNSANFTFQIIGDEVIFSVKGHGHGVGMSQRGADYMAKQGKIWIEILKHYYQGVDIKDIDEIL